ALDNVEPADRLLRLGERTVGDERLPVADADRAGPARRGQLVAGDPDAARLEVVQPREALLVRAFSRVGLGLGVHLLGVPADQHQEFHGASCRRLPTSDERARSRSTFRSSDRLELLERLPARVAVAEGAARRRTEDVLEAGVGRVAVGAARDVRAELDEARRGWREAGGA